MKKDRVLARMAVVAPTPPPYAGPEISTLHILQSDLATEFVLHHIKSNVKANNAEKGAFSWTALWRQVAIYLRVIQSRLGGSNAIYTLLAVNVLGFLKDAGTIWLGKLLGMKVCAHMKGATLPAFYRKSGPPMKWIIKRTLRSLDMLVVQAEPIRSEILSTFDRNATLLPVIPNMVEGTAACLETETRDHLFFMGHLSVGKGFVDLIEVFDSIAPDYDGVRLLCAGEPKTLERDYVAQLTGVGFSPESELAIRDAMAGKRDAVDYLGVLTGEGKERAFCSSGVFVLPSYSESFPMSVLEAMSHGCAVVATRVGAIPEVITDGVEGILVEPGDKAELESALRKLLSDPEMRIRLGKQARKKVQESYTVEKVVPLYSEAFRQLMA